MEGHALFRQAVHGLCQSVPDRAGKHRCDHMRKTKAHCNTCSSAYSLRTGLLKSNASQVGRKNGFYFPARAGLSHCAKADGHRGLRLPCRGAALGRSPVRTFDKNPNPVNPEQGCYDPVPWLLTRSETKKSKPAHLKAAPTQDKAQHRVKPAHSPPPSGSGAPHPVASPGQRVEGRKHSSSPKSSNADDDRKARSLAGDASTSAAATPASNYYSTQTSRKPRAGHGPSPANSTGQRHNGFVKQQPQLQNSRPPPSPPTSDGQTHASATQPAQTHGSHTQPAQKPVVHPQPAQTRASHTQPSSNDRIDEADSDSFAKAQPSQYAQREVPFDVEASRKRGSNPIRDLLETQKIVLHDYAPGQKPKSRCPQCHGGSTHEASLSVNISPDSLSAAWLCHRATCGWEGGIDQKAGW